MSYQAPAAAIVQGAANMSSAAAGSAASGHKGAPPKAGSAFPAINQEDLVFRIDIVLIITFGVFALFMMPRILATLSRPAHFFTAFLRRPSNGEYTGSPAREYGNGMRTKTIATNAMGSASSFSHYSSEASSTARITQFPPPLPRGGTAGAPPRVRTWITYTHPAVVYALNRPIWGGVTLSKSIVLLGYFGLLLYAGFNQSDPFSNPKRAGYIAVSQIPIVVALATKNNVLSWLSGEGYEKLNYIHRFGGLMAVLATNLHGLGYTFKWAQNGSFYDDLKLPKYQYGMAAWGAMDLLFLGSLESVRRKSYTFFLFSHIAGFGVLLGTLYNHFPVTWGYIYAALAIYGFDLLLRTLRTRAATAYVTAHPNLNNGTTSVHFPEITKGFRAGQHVRVRFVDPSSGALGWIRALLFARTRPFSISSRPGASGLELLVKKEGSSTKRLFDAAKGTTQTMSEKLTGLEAGAVESRRIKAIVEGPYGGPSATMFEAFSGAFLVAGGSGVSFILSFLDDLINKHVEGRSRTRAIEVVWSVGDIGSLVELLPTLRPLLRPRISPQAEMLSVQMTVHYTRASRFALPDPAELPAGLHIRSGRPDLSKALKTSVSRTIDATSSGGRFSAQGVIATCCGPTALAEQLNKAVGGLEYSLWKQAGGVETASETFGW